MVVAEAVPSKVSTKDFFLHLTPGKLTGLKNVSDAQGRLKVLALDQSNSFKKFLRALYEKQGKKREPSYEEIRDAKLEITEILSPFASGVLLDVNYGARQSLNSGAIAHGVGLIVRLEASKDPGIASELEPGWSVPQIKKMGGAAVKLLVYMDVEDAKATKGQMDFVKFVSKECQDQDILLMTEELSYPRSGEDKGTPAYVARKPRNIFASAEMIGPYTDILKLEYPANIKTDDVKTQEKNLNALNEKAIRPWVLLSAGEKFDFFAKQVELAMKSGASGIMAGRAIFQEYFDYTDRADQKKFLQTTGIDRMKKLSEIVDKYAASWQKRVGISASDHLKAVPSDWYATGAVASGAGAQGEY
ncbi:MAG: tagatose 1,6-diphosphate aldolase [Elusimicrobia bacterium]|nr:tagatose 1,6-diphosphate aldolase [Elusimicrobiota bacterium]